MLIQPGLKRREKAAKGFNLGMRRFRNINRPASRLRHNNHSSPRFLDRQKVFSHKHTELGEILLLHRLQYRLAQFKVGQDIPPQACPLHQSVGAELKRFSPNAKAASGVSEINELEPQLDRLRVEILSNLLEINGELVREGRPFGIKGDIDPNASPDTGIRSLLEPMSYGSLPSRVRHSALRYYLKKAIETLQTDVEGYEEFLRSKAKTPGDMVKDAHSRFAHDLLTIAREIDQKDDMASEFLVGHTLKIMGSLIVDLRH